MKCFSLTLLFSLMSIVSSLHADSCGEILYSPDPEVEEADETPSVAVENLPEISQGEGLLAGKGIFPEDPSPESHYPRIELGTDPSIQKGVFPQEPSESANDSKAQKGLFPQSDQEASAKRAPPFIPQPQFRNQVPIDTAPSN